MCQDALRTIRIKTMSSYSALTTLTDRRRAEDLGIAMEKLVPEPTGIGVFEVEDGSGTWEVGGYFTERPDMAGLALLAAMHDATDFAVSKIDDQDWVAQVRRELHPVHAGRFTVYGSHDSHQVGPHRVGLCIEAAMAFGTGHHGTTQGCLVLLDRLIQQGRIAKRVADIGCGTGVLAMAAAKVWRCKAVATDIDPIAAATARANIRANGVMPWVQTGAGPGFRHAAHRGTTPYDLVFANILAAPLKRLAPDITRHLRSDGVAILSGLLTPQANGVAAVFRGNGMDVFDRVVLGDWTSLALKRTR